MCAEHTHVLTVGEHLAERVVIDDRAAHGRTAQRLLGGRELQVDELRGGQRQNIEHERGGVVRFGARRGAFDQFARGLLRRGAFGQQRVDLAVRKCAMYAIAADEVAIVQVRGFLEMIDAQTVLRANRARQRVRGARRPERVVRGERLQLVVAHPVNTRIPNMDQMGTPSRTGPVHSKCRPSR